MSIDPWSFSKIKAFEQCPKQFYHMRIAKDYAESETEAMLYGTAFHEAAEEYVRDGTPMPPQFDYALAALDILKDKQGDKLCEYRLGLTQDLKPCGFSDEGVWFRGVADLIILDDDLAWVVDYKTGKSARYADKGQLELMALATFKHFPQVEKVRWKIKVYRSINVGEMHLEQDVPHLIVSAVLVESIPPEPVASLCNVEALPSIC